MSPEPRSPGDRRAHARLARELPPLGPLWGSALRLAGAHSLVRRLQAQAEVNWIAAHEPALWARAARVGLHSAWLSERLVGQWVDSVGCQVGGLPFDHRQLCWAGAAGWRWRSLAVRSAQLPRRVPPASTPAALAWGAAMNYGVAQVIWFGLARALPPQASIFAIMAVPLVGTPSAAFIVGEVPALLDFIAAGFIMLAIASALLPVRAGGGTRGPVGRRG